jgi:hypothetical protein
MKQTIRNTVAVAVASMILAGCATKPEQRDSMVVTAGQIAVIRPDGSSMVFRDRAEKDAYDAAEAQKREKEKADAAAWKDWYESEGTQAFIKKLCTTPPGPDKDKLLATAREYKLGVHTCRPEWTVPTTEPAAAAPEPVVTPIQ